MKKCRIIKRTFGNEEKYVIQQKHLLFRWMWVDAWINNLAGASCKDTFYSLEEAQANLYLFDGTLCKEELIEEH